MNMVALSLLTAFAFFAASMPVVSLVWLAVAASWAIVGAVRSDSDDE